MRLFVGALLSTAPEAVRCEIKRIRDEIVTRDPGWRAVPEVNLHVTLAFLGNVLEERAEDVMERMVGLRSLLPFVGRLGFCAAPQDRVSSRVLAVGLEPRDVWAKHLQSVRHCLGVGADVRSDWAHVTVCRSRDPRPWQATVTDLSVRATDPWIIGELALVHSQPAPGGSLYTVLSSVSAH